MALLPMGQATEHPSATQESMFEEPIGFPGPDPEEMAYLASEDVLEEVSDEPPYEADEDFSAEALETASEELGHEPVQGPFSSELGTVVASGASEPAVHPATDPVIQPALEPATQQAQPVSQSNTAAEADSQPLSVLSVDDFAALEERVFRAVNLVRNERQARAAAEERAVALEAQLAVEHPAVERLQQEVDSLRIEREQVRQRVERLLSQLDALEL
ncbi:hypothetical protein [Acidicapsa acidisoli]|uniref:hypothetical protein n=1 Tax=Acidicapsa acidisoli TaxID=1615681 RepID=UPI0021E03D86|nr:hypothetical protein [Acidicapsa acidisoli]